MILPLQNPCRVLFSPMGIFTEETTQAKKTTITTLTKKAKENC